LPSRRAQRAFDVVFFAPHIGPLLAPGGTRVTGGAETQIAMLARRLADAGYRVCVVALDLPGGLPPVVDGVAIRAIRRPARAPRPWVGARVAWTLARARAPVLVQRAAGPETGLASLVARATRRRFVYSSANVSDFDYGALEQGRTRVRLFELGVRLASEVVVQTDEQVALCRQRFDRTPVVIRSIASVEPPGDAPRVAFLWIGRREVYKRPEDFLRLAEAMPEAHFRMVLAGAEREPGERITELRDRAAALANVEWLAPRPREELLKLYDSAVAVVSTGEYEGMANVFLEGWARGVPALSLHHDPDGVIERERLGAFAHGDFNRLVDAARGLWEARDDTEAIAQRCRAYVAGRHDPDVAVRQWIDVLRL
jgi:glycosyltransferase involved in cell wall biosynthesis